MVAMFLVGSQQKCGMYKEDFIEDTAVNFSSGLVLSLTSQCRYMYIFCDIMTKTIATINKTVIGR